MLTNKISRGAQINPAVSVAVWITDRQCYAETLTRITGQICGGLIAWNAAGAITTVLVLPPFQGPEYGRSLTISHEMLATLCLCLAVFIMNLGKKLAIEHVHLIHICFRRQVLKVSNHP